MTDLNGSPPTGDTLVKRARATADDLAVLTGELNSYIDQLRSLLEQMEAGERDE